MKDKKFVEVVDISSNHTFVVGSVGKGKRSDIFKQLLREKENKRTMKYLNLLLVIV